ncbi:MAG TPA: HAD family hydrolase [Blastocatellia bacterium]|nr:HAD family hydrolase [Blastocatellia bacterium]
MSSADHKAIEVIAFDADDTLWHNESLFTVTQTKFKQLLAGYHSDEWIEAKLNETEHRNIEHFGYGIKGFTLSMIETAIELTEGRISGAEIQQIINYAKAMRQAPVELLDGVAETISALAGHYTLMLITKGDLFDQESKIARSGLGDHFSHLEIVSEKNTEVYRTIMSKHRLDPRRFLMVGNSIKSDILPVIEAGGRAVHVPYHTTWVHEQVSDYDAASFYEIASLRELPALLTKIS